MGYYFNKMIRENDHIAFKTKKISFIKDSLTKEVGGATDKTSLAYDVFEHLFYFEEKLNKPIEQFNSMELHEVFETFSIIEQVKVLAVLINYFDFLDVDKAALKEIQLGTHDERTIVTFEEFKNIIANIVEYEGNNVEFLFNKFYVASVLILIYYGLSAMDLIDFRFSELETSNKLYGKVDKIFIPILQKSSRQNNFIAKNTKGNPKYYEFVNEGTDIICKPRTIQTDKVRVNHSYYRIIKPYLDVYKPTFNLNLKRIALSGSFHFIVKKSLEEGLDIQKDFLYRENKTYKDYKRVMEKYNVVYTSVRSREEWIYAILKECNEQISKQNIEEAYVED